MKFLSNFFHKLWAYGKSFSAPYNPADPTPMVQEDIRSKEQVKRFLKAYEAQKESLRAGALKAHHCDDPWTCTQDPCFKFVPDRIVRTMKVRPLRKKK